MVPRVLAFAASTFALTIFFVLTALLAGNVAANVGGIGTLTLSEFADSFLRAMGASEYLALALKPIAIGYTVGVVVVVTALGGDESVSVYSVISRGFMRSVLAVLLVSGLFTAVL